MRSTPLRIAVALALPCLSASCGSSSGSTSAPQLQIVAVSGAPLRAVAGDAVALQVVEQAADGSTQVLAAGSKVTWTIPDIVATLPPDSTAPSPLPAPVALPLAVWIDNASRPDRSADLGGVLFILDPGTTQNATVKVRASVVGAAPGDSSPATVEASIPVTPTPTGDWTRGAALYGPTGANCALCHGATGHGSGDPDSASYLIAGAAYAFPAPGLNAEPGNSAGDPAWNAALFAVAARADMDNGGIALRLPMPDWLTQPNPATGQPLSTQDLADIFAFLGTQIQ